VDNLTINLTIFLSIIKPYSIKEFLLMEGEIDLLKIIYTCSSELTMVIVEEYKEKNKEYVSLPVV
jgi:hypothetical protein